MLVFTGCNHLGYIKHYEIKSNCWFFWKWFEGKNMDTTNEAIPCHDHTKTTSACIIRQNQTHTWSCLFNLASNKGLAKNKKIFVLQWGNGCILVVEQLDHHQKKGSQWAPADEKLNRSPMFRRCSITLWNLIWFFHIFSGFRFQYLYEHPLCPQINPWQKNKHLWLFSGKLMFISPFTNLWSSMNMVFIHWS